MMSSPLAAIADGSFDAVVLGGGISGAGIARRLAEEGRRVVLVEPRDFGWGTSGRSSRLIHGGLRYLAALRLRAVQHALTERRVLLQSAQHLVRPCPFVVPLRPDDSALWRFGVRAGIWLYDQLSLPRRGWPHPRRITREQVETLLPCASFPEGTGFLLYHDASTDDRRLTLLTALDARRRGARLAPRCQAVAVRAVEGGEIRVDLRDSLSGDLATLRTRCVINATGAWVDQTRRALGLPADPALVRPARGTHLLVGLPAYAALLARHPDDGRVVLSVPVWGGQLVGTTDKDHQGLPSMVRPDAEEIEYLRRFVDQLHPDNAWTMVTNYAGLRPLAAAAGHPDRLSRAHRLVCEERLGLRVLHVVGGKLTTHRLVARDVARRIERWLPPAATPAAPPSPCLPGGDLGSVEGEQARARATGLSAVAARWMVLRYGSQWELLLRRGRTEDGEESAEPLAAGHEVPLRAEVRWAVEEEGVRCLADLLLRWRLPELGGDEEALLGAAEREMARICEWSDRRTVRERERWLDERDLIYPPA